MGLDTLFSILVLIMSVVVHEVSHGLAANYLGDPTARLAGRLTLNPLRHLDLFGSIILPLLLIATHAGFVFGWAKPVPVNPYNLRKGLRDEAIVAGAGPFSNLVLAFLFGLFIRFGGGVFPSPFLSIAAVIVVVNCVLAVFNLVPIPPLDGSKVLFAFLPQRLAAVQAFLERYWLVTLFVFIFFLWDFLFPVIGFLFRIFTGGSF